MKNKTIVSLILALFGVFINHAKAQECCGGQPLPADDICCSDQPYDSSIYMCCSASQEAAWQASYDSCKSDANTERNDAENDEQTAYNDTKATLDAGCAAAGSLCGASGSPAYEICYDACAIAEGPEYTGALEAYSAEYAGSELEYSHEVEVCYENAHTGYDEPDCADGWHLNQ